MSLNDSSWSQASLPIQAAGRAQHHEFCHLATSAFLASAAGSSSIAQQILPSSVAISSCPFKEEALSLWSQSHDSELPTGANASKQREWDTPIVDSALSPLLSSADEPVQGRLLAAQRKESGAWISAPPMSSLGLRMHGQ